ncbi:hypothetical protein A0H81_02910 [Grifola frondosa]|uniref:Uncharacterized protein n=1 Tax=Grifola frondosa TaxID=5627 RepID=A0A1C7MHQ6_GRIFR|nr:hypothetical protein A0H81_02910 [Grifola frondosa]
MTDNDSSDPNSLSAQFSSQMSEYSRTLSEDDYLKGLSQFGTRNLNNAELYWEAQISDAFKELERLNSCNAAIVQNVHDLSKGQDRLVQDATQLGAEIGDLRIEFAESLDNVKRSLAKIKAEARDWRNLQGKSSGGEVDILRDKVTKLEFDTTVLKTQRAAYQSRLGQLEHDITSIRATVQSLSSRVERMEEAEMLPTKFDEFTLRENLLSELYHAAASLRLQIGDEDVAELNSLQGALVLHRSGKKFMAPNVLYVVMKNSRSTCCGFICRECNCTSYLSALLSAPFSASIALVYLQLIWII